MQKQLFCVLYLCSFSACIPEKTKNWKSEKGNLVSQLAKDFLKVPLFLNCWISKLLLTGKIYIQGSWCLANNYIWYFEKLLFDFHHSSSFYTFFRKWKLIKVFTQSKTKINFCIKNDVLGVFFSWKLENIEGELIKLIITVFCKSEISVFNILFSWTTGPSEAINEKILLFFANKSISQKNVRKINLLNHSVQNSFNLSFFVKIDIICYENLS